MKMNGGLSADTDAAEPPANTVPETLALPVAGTIGIGHGRRSAVQIVALRRGVVAGATIVARRAIALGVRGSGGCHDRGSG